jgi:hypothetical protein
MTLLEVVEVSSPPEILEIELRQTGFKSENGSLNRQNLMMNGRMELLFGGWCVGGAESLCSESWDGCGCGREDRF